MGSEDSGIFPYSSVRHFMSLYLLTLIVLLNNICLHAVASIRD